MDATFEHLEPVCGALRRVSSEITLYASTDVNNSDVEQTVVYVPTRQQQRQELYAL